VEAHDVGLTPTAGFHRAKCSTRTGRRSDTALRGWLRRESEAQGMQHFEIAREIQADHRETLCVNHALNEVADDEKSADCGTGRRIRATPLCGLEDLWDA